MSDTISRQAAIDALEKCHKQCCREDATGDEWIHYETTLNEVESIPPAPKNDADCISRQAAIKYLITNMNWYDEDGYESDDDYKRECITELINGVPSAQSEPCEDAVSRKAVYDAMVEKGQRSRRYKLGEIWELNVTEIREALDTVPSVTPKQKRGKWINGYCSKCGKHAPFWAMASTYYKTSFCPNCGADMRGEQDG